ncbi:MAG: class I tRNA ligase family protein, partial [Acidobacteriota bacterium]|nr:class I tRNA ligase family protein [Acidobacteriota bacterium]
WRNIFAALDAALRLLHPVMPFLTEELWHRLPQREGARSIALDRYPEPQPHWMDAASDVEMAILQEIVVAARNIRAEMKVDPKKKVAAEFFATGPMRRTLVQENLDPILRLASLSELRIMAGHIDAGNAAAASGIVRSTAAFDLSIAYGEAVDKQAETARLKKEMERLAKDVEAKQNRLADQNFVSKAPEKIVDGLRATLEERQLELKKLRDRLRQLE